VCVCVCVCVCWWGGGGVTRWPSLLAFCHLATASDGFFGVPSPKKLITPKLRAAPLHCVPIDPPLRVALPRATADCSAWVSAVDRSVLAVQTELAHGSGRTGRCCRGSSAWPHAYSTRSTCLPPRDRKIATIVARTCIIPPIAAQLHRLKQNNHAHEAVDRARFSYST
jgi:hypothetical protein